MHMIKPLDMASYILDIYPGTALYAMYQEKTGHGDDIWRRKIEDIMYFETDSALSAETVLDFGEKLRSEFYRNLHRYAAGIELVDDRDLYREHADFCSRLGLTFSHGHFARTDAVRQKEETAAALFARALQYHPDQRAYLGLAIIQQKNRAFSRAAATATEGIRHFPASEELHICQAISYMNLGHFRQALTALEGCRGSPAAAPYIKECRRLLDQEER
jgi:anaerobic magnesium-protoporphyrin IX monomethyl ester cyclase